MSPNQIQHHNFAWGMMNVGIETNPPCKKALVGTTKSEATLSCDLF
jgi:hypothetical protein